LLPQASETKEEFAQTLYDDKELKNFLKRYRSNSVVDETNLVFTNFGSLQEESLYSVLMYEEEVVAKPVGERKPVCLLFTGLSFEDHHSTGKTIKVYHPREDKELDYFTAYIQDAASFSDMIGLYGGLQEAEEDPSTPGHLKALGKDVPFVFSYDSVKNNGVYATRSLSLGMQVDKLSGEDDDLRRDD